MSPLKALALDTTLTCPGEVIGVGHRRKVQNTALAATAAQITNAAKRETM